MATTKISSTKSTSRAINYAEKRAEEKSGLNCEVEYAKGSFKAVRELCNKTSGNQGHVVIQSFKPDEVTPKECNELGLELAQKIAPNHQVVVYTHADTDHVHNHIVINAVNIETGKKFNNNKKALHDIRQANDDICRKHDLSVPERNAEMRYSQAEKSLIEKGKRSWKDDIRQAIDETQATNYEELENELSQKGIRIERITNKLITYKHMEEDKKVRGNRLGDKYGKGGLEIEFARQIQQREEEREREQEQRAEQYSDEFKVNWDKFGDIANERRDKRVEKAKQIARENDDRSRKFARNTQFDNRFTNKRIEKDDNELSR